MNKLLILFSAILLVACDALPSVGPTRANIMNSSSKADYGGNTHIVDVSERVAVGLRVPSTFGFPSSLRSAGSANYEAIKAGDVLQVTVWENVDNGVFASLGSRVTQLAPMRVSEKGTIFVPYVGEVRATNRTADQLRAEITNRLATQTPEPQVEVTREAGSKGSVMVFSDGGGGGLVPLNEGNLKLASMLASAGGAPGDPQSTRLTVTRGSTSGTILVQDLYDNPRNNIPLRNSDRITIEQDRRFYRFLGSGGAQSLVPFSRADIMVLDAIAENGGLNSSVSDPTGIFVMRTVSAKEANTLLGTNVYTTSQNFAFTINLKKPDGLFIAQKFQVRDKDTIYITEAPYVTWTKVISAVSASARSLESLTNAGSLLNTSN